MKMFWGRDKTVRIEFASPPVVVTAAAPSVSGGVAAEKTFSSMPINLEQFLKLAAVMVAVVNAALVVLGYMRYVGLLQQFGISRTEVAFTFSDLLSFGYVGFLNMTLSGQIAVAAVSTGITLPVMAIVIRAKRNLHSLLQFILIWCVSMGLFFLVTAPYWIAYNPGKQAAFMVVAKSLGVDEEQLLGLETEQEVSTENGPLIGNIILAMPDITFLLKDGVLYKVRASDGKILRKTHLRAKLKPTGRVQ
ncbi:hypothetical protein [Pseudomonas sp.]|uniref:hypothetical protein n=1 Tax=Pseudomonas sp. TaxID=306 RepID=UPI003D0B8DEA